MPAAIGSYERVFGLRRRFVHENNLYAEMETGETALAFVGEQVAEVNGLAIRPNRKTEIAAGFEIVLVTDDPYSAYTTAVAAGAAGIKPPAEKP